jgi:hypothetical protein
MSGFSADWLSLREPYDVAARNQHVLGAVAAAFATQGSIAVVDLACGTGSTLRAISSHLPSRQSWRLVDNDLGLLARAASFAVPPNMTLVTKPVDLVRDLEFALEGPLDLIATSALLDLVSAEWLDRLAVEAAARRLPLYAALTYDGRIVLDPRDDLDFEILSSFNAHQRTEKEFGLALGPTAAAYARECFETCGYRVVQGFSDWLLQPSDAPIQEALFAGWAQVAEQSGTLSSDAVCAWLARRRSRLTAGHSKLAIGHVDILALPMGAR